MQKLVNMMQAVSLDKYIIALVQANTLKVLQS
jgi:hypothetical protein